MALTFRSSTPESKIVIERETDGRQRVARAVKNAGSTRHWDLTVEHPSGQNWRGTFTGDNTEVVGALNKMLSRTENEWRGDRARGDRPKQAPADHNRSVNEGFSPIRGIPGR